MRTQIALDAEAHRRARERAAELGISLAEYVRRLVDRDLDLGRREPQADVAQLFDLGDGGPTDVGRDLDDLLGEATASRPAG